MQQSTRRRFIRQAATVIASIPGARGLAFAGLAAGSPGPARMWTTTPESKFQQSAAPPWQSSRGATPPGITVDPARQFQSILGFGGAFTDASCYLLHRMQPAARHQLLQELLGAGGLRMSVGRTCIGSSDYSRSAYSFDDSSSPDPELQRFSIAHDRAYILPTLRAAQAVNPNLFFFSTPWSPPGWMKAGGSLLGGSMRKQYFASYAEYFLKFLQAYQAEEIKVRAITTQNEVDTDQDGRMPAALWGQEYEADFIKSYLGPAIHRSSFDTKIWLLDHNYNLWGRVLDQLSDPEVFRYVDGVAWHGYVGTPDAMTRVHNAFPSKRAYWTEGGPDISSPDYATDWAAWSATFAKILKNWARCIVSWNLVLDENGSPNIGPFRCGGVVTVNSRTQQIVRSGQYWAFAHYSKAVQIGARVIASHGEFAGIEHVAFQNPDGSHVLVVANQGGERVVPCSFQDKTLALNLPGNSVTTSVW